MDDLPYSKRRCTRDESVERWLPHSSSPAAHPDTSYCDSLIVRMDQAGSCSFSDLDRKETARPQLICYGMAKSGQLEDLPIINIPTSAIIDSRKLVSASLNGDDRVHRRSDGALIGRLDNRARQCLIKMAEEEDVKVQLMIKSADIAHARKHKTKVVALAAAIIYGPDDIGDDIGYFLDKCGYNLQDPFGCDRNVLYKNPHCIYPLLEACPMTFDLQGTGGDRSLEPSVEDSLSALETTDILPEWQQPTALKTQLYRHQRQALWFLVTRDQGQGLRHIWRQEKSGSGSTIYINEINGDSQDVPPPIWRGGILADEMGLGKTLQMISLIVVDKLNSVLYRNTSVLDATLVVMPPSLIKVWEEQIHRHVHEGQLSWALHYGKSRLPTSLNGSYPDIVITTYQTMRSDYKRQASKAENIFAHRWRRIILDEAHIIRNLKTATSEAVMALNGVSRWAVTGTPIQNSLMDLTGLLTFLRFAPYDDRRNFDEDIVEPFRQDNNTTVGTERLKMLCHTIMIRRHKTVVDLPQRQNSTKHIEFSDDEAMYYQKIEASAREIPEAAIEANAGVGRARINAIQLINNLRIFFNLGMSVASQTSKVLDSEIAATCNLSKTKASLADVIASETALGAATCTECNTVIEVPDVVDTANTAPYAFFSECRQVYCRGCAPLGSNRATLNCLCTEETPCSLRPLSTAMVQAVHEGGVTTSQTHTAPSHALSSKVRAVIEEIQSHPAEKSVVFSFWTSTLDMVQHALDAARIRWVRIDGSVPVAKRKTVLEQFGTTADVQVMLITVSCGGVGIDLTAATRIHLLEPQWNPAVEDQALARVHRMGQQRPVVAIRYIMKGSIEESVALARGNKLLLAELLPRTAESEPPEEETVMSD